MALGPLCRNLLPLYARWINDPETAPAVGSYLPFTAERETEWYEKEARSETNIPFTIYERTALRPIGTVALMGVDYRNRKAEFGIGIGEPDYRNKGYGTETTRLMLDYAFNVVGLHNVMLGVFEFNGGAIRAGGDPGLREGRLQGDWAPQAELLRGRPDVGRDLDGLPELGVRGLRARERCLPDRLTEVTLSPPSPRASDSAAP